jgi:hypothetical protein
MKLSPEIEQILADLKAGKTTEHEAARRLHAYFDQLCDKLRDRKPSI